MRIFNFKKSGLRIAYYARIHERTWDARHAQHNICWQLRREIDPFELLKERDEAFYFWDHDASWFPKMDGGELKILREAVQLKEVDLVIVANRARITRNPLKFRKFVKELTDQGCGLVTFTGRRGYKFWCPAALVEGGKHA